MKYSVLIQTRMLGLGLLAIAAMGCSNGPSVKDVKSYFDPSRSADAGASDAASDPRMPAVPGTPGVPEAPGSNTTDAGDDQASQVPDASDLPTGVGSRDAGDREPSGPVELEDCVKAPDFDHDGVVGKCDNCPRRKNADQADADGDGFGDACDGCNNLTDPTCASDVKMTLPNGGDYQIIGVTFEVAKSKRALYEELSLPMCMPEHTLGMLRMYSFTDTPVAPQQAKENWIDLKSDHYGTEGWQNEGIFIPEEFRWFYEPTAPLGGWKKQYITTTVWEKTAQGFRATNKVGDQLFWQLEFTRGAYDETQPAYLRTYIENPYDYIDKPEPQYILSPAELEPASLLPGQQAEPVSYTTTDPVVYNSTWTPSGPITKKLERGTVKITWSKPTLPAGMKLDLRFLDLLPPSGTTLPGWYVEKSPSETADEQNLAHLSRGYGECSKLKQ